MKCNNLQTCEKPILIFKDKFIYAKTVIQYMKRRVKISFVVINKKLIKNTIYHFVTTVIPF